MTSSYSKLAKTLSDLAIDSPQVIAERLSRMSEPHAMFSAKNQTEFTRMVMEKQAAATESYMALLSSNMTYYQKAWTDLALGKVGFNLLPTASATAKTANDVLLPYKKRASANAKRLAK